MSKRSVILFAGVLVLVVGALVIAAKARRSTESVECGNLMVSIGYAARLWANDRDGILPSDFLSISNEVIAPRFLVCPGDNSRQPAASWAVFSAVDSSYEIVNSGLQEDDTNGVFLRCKIHGHLGYADTTVFDGVRRRRKIQ